MYDEKAAKLLVRIFFPVKFNFVFVVHEYIM